LTPQFEWLPQVLAAIGMTQAQAPGWEADDAIGTLSEQAGSGDRIDIITGDRDLLQLVHDGDGSRPVVRLLFTVRGVSNLEAFDAAAVEGKYGVPPHRYVDFATLRGDPSDGLPGVPGIGEKTAARLINEYASLDDLVAGAGNLSPRLSANLLDASDYLLAMEQIVPIRRDVDVVVTRPAGDEAELARLAEELGLGGPVGRLTQALHDE
jgi:5'-3' exonuclease